MITDQPVNNHDDLLKAVDAMLAEAGLDRKDTGGKLTFAGMDPIRPTVLKVGSASAIVAAANAVAAAIMWKMRSGESQDIHVDLRKAYTIQSAWQDILADCTLLNGVSMMLDPNQYGPSLSILNTKDNRWVLMGAPYPSQQRKVSRLFNSGYLPDQLANAARQWDAEDLEKDQENGKLEGKAEGHDHLDYEADVFGRLVELDKILSAHAGQELQSFGNAPIREPATHGKQADATENEWDGIPFFVAMQPRGDESPDLPKHNGDCQRETAIARHGELDVEWLQWAGDDEVAILARLHRITVRPQKNVENLVIEDPANDCPNCNG